MGFAMNGIVIRLLAAGFVALFLSGCANAPSTAGELTYRSRAVTRTEGGLRVSVTVLSAEESAAVYGVPLDQIGKYIEQVQAVTPRQIEKYAHKHLAGEGTTVVVVGDAGQFAGTIRKAHPHAALLQSTALDLDSPSLQPAAGPR